MHLLRIGATISAASGGAHNEELMSLGRWRNEVTAVHYSRAARRSPTSIAVGSWPTRRTNLLENMSLDTLSGRLMENGHKFTVGKHLFNTGEAVTAAGEAAGLR